MRNSLILFVLLLVILVVAAPVAMCEEVTSEQLAALRAQLELYQKQLKDAVPLIASLKAENAKLRESVDGMKAENTKLQETLDRLQIENAELKQDIEALRAEGAKLKQRAHPSDSEVEEEAGPKPESTVAEKEAAKPDNEAVVVTQTKMCDSLTVTTNVGGTWQSGTITPEAGRKLCLVELLLNQGIKVPAVLDLRKVEARDENGADACPVLGFYIGASDCSSIQRLIGTDGVQINGTVGIATYDNMTMTGTGVGEVQLNIGGGTDAASTNVQLTFVKAPSTVCLLFSVPKSASTLVLEGILGGRLSVELEKARKGTE